MVRLATHNDTTALVDLLREFLSETSYSKAEQAVLDREHLCKIIWMVQQHGYAWIAEKDGLAVGLLLAIKQPNMWVPKAIELRELVWFVLPEHRKTSIGGKLFLAYCSQADLLLSQGKIQGYFTTRMSTTDSIGLQRRGFRLTEQTFIKER